MSMNSPSLPPSLRPVRQRSGVCELCLKRLRRYIAAQRVARAVAALAAGDPHA